MDEPSGWFATLPLERRPLLFEQHPETVPYVEPGFLGWEVGPISSCAVVSFGFRLKSYEGVEYSNIAIRRCRSGSSRSYENLEFLFYGHFLRFFSLLSLIL